MTAPLLSEETIAALVKRASETLTDDERLSRFAEKELHKDIEAAIRQAVKLAGEEAAKEVERQRAYSRPARDAGEGFLSACDSSERDGFGQAKQRCAAAIRARLG